MIINVFSLVFALNCIYFERNLISGFLFPQYSVFQITSAFSVPVEIPNRKLFFDFGFQMNYNLPFDLSNFYNVPIWPRQKRYSTEIFDMEKVIYKYAPNLTTHHFDLTAGELYISLEDLLISFGFDESCLLKSVCDLARHPIDMSYYEENLYADIITFLLTPSLHNSFADDEEIYKNVYEMAEFYGKTGNNCDDIYPECRVNILDSITKIIYDN